MFQLRLEVKIADGVRILKKWKNRTAKCRRSSKNKILMLIKTHL